MTPDNRNPAPAPVEHNVGPAAWNKTGYRTDTIYVSRNGSRYRADENGTLRRADGPKLSKRERRQAKREAVREMRRR